ncbi:phosphoglucomutase, alpha-D-glucose phosphate-specific, partial [Vibrio parahaemolyticus]
GRDPSQIYAALTEDLGAPRYERIDQPATAQQKAILKALTPAQIDGTILAGDTITSILTKAPGNGAGFGGLKV